MSLIRETIVFDACGDLYLILERPEETSVNNETTRVISAPDDLSEDTPTDDVPTDHIPPDIMPPDDPPVADVAAVGRPVGADPNEHDRTDESSEHGHRRGEQAPTNPARNEIELRVSWKHLSLASKVFAKESPRTDDKDERTIPLLQDDFGAMQILLNIIHGWTRKVPRQLDVQVLKRVVGLIDKYEFHEAAEIFTEMWFESLRPTILHDQQQNLASGIVICSVLQKPAEYTILTKRAIWETDGELEDSDGLVPYWINQEIQSRRQAVLKELISTLSKLLGRYKDPQPVCHRYIDCDPLALGKLTRGLTKIGLDPIPEPSTIKLSLEALFSTIHSMELSPLCDYPSGPKRGRSHYWDLDEGGDNIHMNEELANSLSKIQDDIHGLELRYDAYLR